MLVDALYSLHPSLLSSVLACVICFLTWTIWKKRDPISPPGTNGLPLLGVAASLRKFPERTFTKWTKLYGPLYMVKVGLKNVVVISDQEIAYKAFAKNDCFNDRLQSIALFHGSPGLIMLNRNDFQKEQRRFGLITLRSFGMGQRSLEPTLLDLSHKLCEDIEALCTNGISRPFSILVKLSELTSNVISHMTFGTDICKENKEFYELLKIMINTEDVTILSALLMVVPSLRHLPYFSSLWQKGLDLQERYKKAIIEEIEEHRRTIDSCNPRDYIDCFLNQIDKAARLKDSGVAATEEDMRFQQLDGVDDCEGELDFSSSWKPLSSFYVDQLAAVVRDLFIAGTDTTTVTVQWIVLFLCQYQDKQKKMIEEIDNVLGQSKAPSMAMRQKLPYVQAVIQEVSRLRPLVPLSLPHLARHDADLMGYRIPKGALLLTNIWAIHHDPKIWPEPEKFSPERHIDESGKFVKSPHWMVFSIGSRSCLGQQLAVMELFIVTVILFQRFHFTFPEGTSPDMDGHCVVSLKPLPFEIIATKR